MLTQSQLKEILDYDASTGLFVWKKRLSCRIRIGDIAKSPTDKGYIRIGINGTRYVAHRLVFLWMTGINPPEQVDHINGNRSDNRFCNLRLATNRENSYNNRKRNSNTSGYKGVSFVPHIKKWHAYVDNKDGRHLVGYFSELSDAAIAVKSAREKLHGEFARHE